MDWDTSNKSHHQHQHQQNNNIPAQAATPLNIKNQIPIVHHHLSSISQQQQ
jgi:hypothetical protein